MQGVKGSRGNAKISKPKINKSEESGEMLKNYKDLKVWQKSYQSCLEIYRITKGFPKEETYGLISQIRRAAQKASGIRGVKGSS